MYWCYIFVELTLNCHFSLAFGLGRSVNPPGPSFTIALFDGSLLAARDPRACLLHCMRVISLLFMAIRLLINLGFFLSAPLSTLLQCECNSRLDTGKLLSWKVSFTSVSLPFSVAKEGFMYLLFVVSSLFTVAALLLIHRLGLYLRKGIHEVSAIGFSPVILVSTMAFLLAGFTSAVSEGLEWRDSGGYFSSVLIFNCMLKRIFKIQTL